MVSCSLSTRWSNRKAARDCCHAALASIDNCANRTLPWCASPVMTRIVRRHSRSMRSGEPARDPPRWRWLVARSSPRSPQQLRLCPWMTLATCLPSRHRPRQGGRGALRRLPGGRPPGERAEQSGVPLAGSRGRLTSPAARTGGCSVRRFYRRRVRRWQLARGVPRGLVPTVCPALRRKVHPFLQVSLTAVSSSPYSAGCVGLGGGLTFWPRSRRVGLRVEAAKLCPAFDEDPTPPGETLVPRLWTLRAGVAFGW